MRAGAIAFLGYTGPNWQLCGVANSGLWSVSPSCEPIYDRNELESYIYIYIYIICNPHDIYIICFTIVDMNYVLSCDADGIISWGIIPLRNSAYYGYTPISRLPAAKEQSLEPDSAILPRPACNRARHRTPQGCDIQLLHVHVCTQKLLAAIALATLSSDPLFHSAHMMPLAGAAPFGLNGAAAAQRPLYPASTQPGNDQIDVRLTTEARARLSAAQPVLACRSPRPPPLR